VKNAGIKRNPPDFSGFSWEALKKIASDGQARRNQAKKRSLRVINEHFEPDFNAAWLSVIVFQSFSIRER
jgi:hypothetical protein